MTHLDPSKLLVIPLQSQIILYVDLSLGARDSRRCRCRVSPVPTSLSKCFIFVSPLCQNIISVCQQNEKQCIPVCVVSCSFNASSSFCRAFALVTSLSRWRVLALSDFEDLEGFAFGAGRLRFCATFSIASSASSRTARVRLARGGGGGGSSANASG